MFKEQFRSSDVVDNLVISITKIHMRVNWRQDQFFINIKMLPTEGALFKYFLGGYEPAYGIGDEYWKSNMLQTLSSG